MLNRDWSACSLYICVPFCFNLIKSMIPDKLKPLQHTLPCHACMCHSYYFFHLTFLTWISHACFTSQFQLQRSLRCLFFPLSSRDRTTATQSRQVCPCLPSDLCNWSKMQDHGLFLTTPSPPTTSNFPPLVFCSCLHLYYYCLPRDSLTLKVFITFYSTLHYNPYEYQATGV